MPNHKTHDHAAYIAAPIIVYGLTYITTIPNAIAIGTGFLVANHYLSPDLDIDSIMNRRWGIFYFIWLPYKKAFHHRSIWTHSGPLSALVRFIYIGVWISPLFLWYIPPGSIFLAAYIAMALADTLHTVLDKTL